jgi:hypothetical protein
MRVMRSFVWMVCCGLAYGAALSSCESAPGAEQVPAQDYASLPQVLGRETGSISGQIRFPSEYTQRSVTVQLGESFFVTHPDGRFHITRIPAGMHRFAVRVKGFEPIEQELKVSPGHNLTVSPMRLALARGQVLGRLVFLDGQSASRLALRLDPAGGIALSDNDGIFRFVGVYSGEHELLIDDSRYYTKALTFQVHGSESHNLGIVQVFRRAGAQNAAISLTADRPR